ncbi:MAG: DUF3426 domain-containing protein [Betaproteobacteria bacterium]|nr:DUF3426 domain-containing protein [Betaproteobacteria bacterium]
MSMVTSCPACTTTFRVNPEQLTQRQGKVRCGQCSGVFDAFKSLATLADEPASGLLVEPPAVAAAATAFGMPQQGTLDIDPRESVRLDDELSDTRSSARTAHARALWVAALTVLVLLLAAQLAYAFRDRLAASWPASRPLLERMCAAVGCTVAWPERPDLLAIEASDLQADPARPNVIVLTATVRNRGSIDVARPALELTLTNAQDQTIARRIFLPRDYLPGAADASSAMPALAEIEVRLALDTADLRPAGYRLFLFYP